jgi:hypothetical protein
MAFSKTVPRALHHLFGNGIFGGSLSGGLALLTLLVLLAPLALDWGRSYLKRIVILKKGCGIRCYILRSRLGCASVSSA